MAAATSREDPRVARSCAAVLAAGDQLLEERGVRGITVDAVAERSGVAKTTIYRHWPSKADLIMEIIERQAFAFPTANTEDPLDDLKVALLALSRGLAEPKRRLALLGTLELAARDPDVATANIGFFRLRGDRIREILERGLESGRFNRDQDPRQSIQLFVGPILLYALMRHDAMDEKGIDRLIARVLYPTEPAG